MKARPALVALAAEMVGHDTSRGAPTRTVMGLLGDRWSTLLLFVLSSGECRHAVLRRVLSEMSDEGDLSQRVLTLKLRALERDGFVLRNATADVPPRVSYALTLMGYDLARQARAMVDWVNANEAAIYASRTAFEAREAD